MERYGHPRFYEMLTEMGETHSAKNHDYAGQADPLANFKECERVGIPAHIGCFIRMQDKYMRIANFIKSGKVLVKGESVHDTLKDLSVYSCLMRILLEEVEQKPGNVIHLSNKLTASEASILASTTGGGLPRD